MRTRRLLGWEAAFFGGALVGTIGCSEAHAASTAPAGASAASAEAAPRPVRLGVVERGPVERPVRAAGLVRRKSEVSLAFKVGGIVTRVPVEEGQTVRKGQVLAEVDAVQVGAAVRQAREALAKATRDLERARLLHDAGAIAVAVLQDAETAHEVARAAVDAASYDAARTVIVAPDDGRIDRRRLEVGELVAPGVPVLQLSGASRGWVVRVPLVDRDVLGVSVGAPAEVRVDAIGGRVFAGCVSQVAPVANPATGTFDVEVRLADDSAELLSGLSAKVAITRTERPGAMVPTSALVGASGGSASVFTVVDGRARRVDAQLAFLHGDRVALRDDLVGVDQIVVIGASKLSDGDAVIVTP